MTAVTTKACLVCGKEYDRKGQSLIWFRRSKYCSQTCRGMATRGRNNPQYRERPTKTCVTCGKEIVLVTKHSHWRAQQRKFCSSKCRSGAYHPHWEGGRYLVSKGYIRVNTGINKTEYEHRVIAERALGRPLKRNESVHHLNFDKADNRPENLLICENWYHRWLHDEMGKRYAQSIFGSRALASAAG